MRGLSKGEKKEMLALTVSSFFISILDIGFYAVLVYIIGIFSGQINVIHTIFGFNIKDLSLVFLLLFAVKNLFGYVVFRKQFGFVYKVASCISRNNLFNYLNGNFDGYTQVDSSVHIRKISYQPIEYCHYVLAGLQQIATEVMLVTLTVIAISIYNPQLFILLLIVIAPPVFFITYFTRKQLKNARENVKSASEKSLQHLQEALSGFVESNIFCKNTFFAKRYFAKQWELNQYLSNIQSLQAAPVRLIETFAVIGLFVLVGANYYFGQSSILNLMNLGAFLVAAYKIIPGIVKIINLSGQVKTYQYAIQQAEEIPYIPTAKNTSVEPPKLQSVEFRNVDFSYESQPVIKNFNLQIKSGEFIGISGISGKGKTTIINLLLGFYNQDKGEILINNKTAEANERKYYWNNVALVKQQPFVFADSILHNIILEDGTSDNLQLEDAIKVSGLEQVLGKLPNGLETIITENAKNISGGQQQRIVLARAIYKNADLLILDEPFSELDANAEAQILTGLTQMAANGKMILFISHNTNSLAFCHKIISLDA